MPTEWSYPNALFPKAPVRADDLKFVLDQLSYGYHCAVLGASNTGKSALLNSLTTPVANQLLAKRILPPSFQLDPDTQLKNNGRATGLPDGESVSERLTDSPRASDNGSVSEESLGIPFLVVFVDCLEAGDSEQALYEVIMRRAVEEFGHHAEEYAPLIALSHDELVEIHRSVLESSNELAFRSSFASGLRKLLHAARCRLLLVFDEFDDTFRSLPPWPFRQLRAAANQHGNQIQYVVATTHRLAYLRQDDETYEFREIFQMSTRSLMPLSVDDSIRFMHYLDTQEPNAPQPQLTKTIVQVAGGHSGLLERIHGLVSQKAFDIPENVSPTDLIELLLQSLPIRTECERLWHELETAEQDAVRRVLYDEPTQETVQILNVKGLLAADDPTRLFSPLLTTHLRRYVRLEPAADGQDVTTGIVCDPDTGQIWADSEEITWTLASEHQRSLVRLLYNRSGAVASYDEIADHVYGVSEGVSPGAIRELVNRTRRKLPDSSYIINVPGEGYRLKV